MPIKKFLIHNAFNLPNAKVCLNPTAVIATV